MMVSKAAASRAPRARHEGAVANVVTLRRDLSATHAGASRHATKAS
jgi:hypothetical protein